MKIEEYIGHDAVDLAERIRSGEVHASDVVELAIRATETANPKINAVVESTYDGARKRAEGPIQGAFAGVPIFVKDTDSLAGVPTRMGSRAMPEVPAKRSSPFVEKILLPLGFVPVGKSTLPEFGLTGTTEPLLTGATRNPWNLEHSPGGSSGGSGALVASGVLPLSHANDGGGSIRIPAAFCGLVGLKCSRGRLPGLEGAKFIPVDIGAQGVLTRSVRDTATFFAAAEKLHPTRLPPIGHVEGPSSQRLRVGYFTEGPGGEQCEPDVQRAVIDAANQLAGLGHEVEEIPNPFDASLLDDFFLFWGFMPFALRLTGRLVMGSGFRFGEVDEWTRGIARYFARNLLRAPGAITRLRRSHRAIDHAFAAHDLLLSPVLTRPPLPLGTISPTDPFEEVFETLKPIASFTPYQNAMGTPALSLPVGVGEGNLPRAVHVMAPFGMERRLLEIAHEFEQARPWAQHYPLFTAED
ncbi:MAG: amidase [bacterium]|nr:amidase [bacterium]MCP5041945.1 amidase [bacterium]